MIASFELLGCNNALKKETFKLGISTPSEVTEIIDGGRADCLLVFKEDGKKDTIPFLAYKKFAKQIDSLSRISKKVNTFLLKIENLKRADNSRYDSVFSLIYW